MTTRPGYVWDATASEWVEIGQAAVLAPIKYQTSQPSSPATGDIWIDSDDEVPSVDSTLYYRWTKTMSGGETSLSGTDNNSLALKYTPGYESVFINGVLQVRGSDYVATTGTTVTGLTALTASDVVMVESIVAYSVGDTYTQSTLDGKFSPITTTGLVLITSATFTAASTVNVNSCFTSTYKNYLIEVNVPSCGTGNVIFRLRASGTDAITNYYWSQVRVNTSGTVSGSGGNPGTSAQFSYSGGGSNISGDICVFDPFSVVTTNVQMRAHGYDGSSYIERITGLIHDTSASYDGFSLIFDANSTGTIKVYGYK